MPDMKDPPQSHENAFYQEMGAAGSGPKLGALLILGREIEDMRRSPLLLLSMATLPTTMVSVPLAITWYLSNYAPSIAKEIVQELYATKGEALAEVLAYAALQNWLPIFLSMPVFLPILISAQSVGGERERRTLEPLLATSVSTLDIVLGKSVAAVLPAIAITWFAAVVFTAGLGGLVYSKTGTWLLPSTAWIFSTVVLAPLMALFGNTLAVAVSVRVHDPRAAQNLAAMSVVPLVGLLVAQMAGYVRVELGFYLLLALILAVADMALVWLCVKLFDRERLLTRWR